MQIINGELFLRKGKEPFTGESASWGQIPLVDADFAFSDINSKIYQVVVKENGLFFRYRNNDGQLSGLKKITMKEIERDMTPLSTYLLNAQHLAFTATIYHDLCEERKNHFDGVILYKDQDFMLIYDLEAKNSSNVLPIRVLDNNSYVKADIISYVSDMYTDPKQLYRDLFMEILKSTKENNKGKNK